LSRTAGRLAVLAIASAALAACASLAPADGEGDGLRVIGDGRHGVVYMRWDAMDWGAAADRYCAGYGGFAQATKVDEHRVRFTCVASAEAPSES
jgi:hypothetical protein